MKNVLRCGKYEVISRVIRVVIIALLVWGMVTISKEILLQSINSSLPPVEAGMLGGILFGDKAGFSKEFYKMLQNSGLLHIVVVSGANVMILAGGMIESLARWVGRKWAITFGLIAGWWYAGLTGWQIPVLRAMILVSIFYWAQMLGRKFQAVRGFILALLLIISADYRSVADVSFWLTTAAFTGVLTAKYLKINFWLEGMWIALWITPIISLVFGKVSLISPIANLMVVYLVGLITTVGMVSLAFQNLWIVLPGLRYLVWVVEWSGNWQPVGFRFNWMMLLGWYLILFYLTNGNKLKNGMES